VHLAQGRYTALHPDDHELYEQTKRRLKFREN